MFFEFLKLSYCIILTVQDSNLLNDNELCLYAQHSDVPFAEFCMKVTSIYKHMNNNKNNGLY